jgi:hypothetical protein
MKLTLVLSETASSILSLAFETLSYFAAAAYMLESPF